MNVLVVDVGGTHVKALATGQDARREFESGPRLTPKERVAGVKKLARGWRYDYRAAFGRPVRIVNDAAMAARARRRGGRGTSGRRRRF